MSNFTKDGTTLIISSGTIDIDDNIIIRLEDVHKHDESLDCLNCKINEQLKIERVEFKTVIPWSVDWLNITATFDPHPLNDAVIATNELLLGFDDGWEVGWLDGCLVGCLDGFEVGWEVGRWLGVEDR